MQKIRESSLLRSCCNILKTMGIVYRKRHGSSFSTAGDPDLFFVVNGQHYEVELKVPGAKPTALQRHRLSEWERAGATCVVIHSVVGLKELVGHLARCENEDQVKAKFQ